WQRHNYLPEASNDNKSAMAHRAVICISVPHFFLLAALVGIGHRAAVAGDAARSCAMAFANGLTGIAVASARNAFRAAQRGDRGFSFDGGRQLDADRAAVRAAIVCAVVIVAAGAFGAVAGRVVAGLAGSVARSAVSALRHARRGSPHFSRATMAAIAGARRFVAAVADAVEFSHWRECATAARRTGAGDGVDERHRRAYRAVVFQ